MNDRSSALRGAFVRSNLRSMAAAMASLDFLPFRFLLSFFLPLPRPSAVMRCFFVVSLRVLNRKSYGRAWIHTMYQSARCTPSTNSNTNGAERPPRLLALTYRLRLVRGCCRSIWGGAVGPTARERFLLFHWRRGRLALFAAIVAHDGRAPAFAAIGGESGTKAGIVEQPTSRRHWRPHEAGTATQYAYTEATYRHTRAT